MKFYATALVLIGVACNEASALKTGMVVAPMANEDVDLDAAFAAAIGQTHEDEELETEVVKATVGTVQLAEGGAAELSSVKQALAAEQVASANLKIKIEKDQKALLDTQKTALARIRSLEAQLKAARAQCSGAPAAPSALAAPAVTSVPVAPAPKPVPVAAPVAPSVPALPKLAASARVSVPAAPVAVPVTIPVKIAAPVAPAAPSVPIAPQAPVVVKAAPAIPVVAVAAPAAPAAPVAAEVAPPVPVVVAAPAPVVVAAPPATSVAAVVAPPAPVAVAAPVKAAPPMAPAAGAPDMSAIMNLFAKVQTDAMSHSMANTNKMRRLERPTPPPRKDFRRHHSEFRGLVIGATNKADE